MSIRSQSLPSHTALIVSNPADALTACLIKRLHLQTTFTICAKTKRMNVCDTSAISLFNSSRQHYHTISSPHADIICSLPSPKVKVTQSHSSFNCKSNSFTTLLAAVREKYRIHYSRLSQMCSYSLQGVFSYVSYLQSNHCQHMLDSHAMRNWGSSNVS